MRLSLPNIVYVDLIVKLIQLATFFEVNSRIHGSHWYLPNSRKVAGFDAVSTEKLKFFNFLH